MKKIFLSIRTREDSLPTNGWMLVSLVFLLSGCGGGSLQRPLLLGDLSPPALMSLEQKDGHSFLMTFDEEIKVSQENASIQPSLSVESLEARGTELELVFADDQAIGESYTGRASVQDEAGNELSFLFRFTGWNPRLPTLVINELNPRGSSSTPDCVEIFVEEGGNLAGVKLVIGTQDRGDPALVFPPVEVATRDYILVHLKGTGAGAEVDETGDTTASEGRLTSDTARDFWFPGAPGLPGNNGAVTLYERPGGPLIDGVIYTDRGNSDKGWTRDGLEMAQELKDQGGWDFPGDSPQPAHAVDISTSTATRSLNRFPGQDSNSPQDWYTAPTSGQTLGYSNVASLSEEEEEEEEGEGGGSGSSPPDTSDPGVVSAEVLDARSLRLIFDPGTAAGEVQSVTLEPPLEVESLDPREGGLSLVLGEDQTAGEGYTGYVFLSGREDAPLVFSFTGWNPRLPRLVINELNPRGSSSTPDGVELYVLEGGNLAGLKLVIGTESREDPALVFPGVEVAAGEYLLIHAKGTGAAEEVDETGDITASGGKLASDTARDFWFPGAPGLPGNNGAVTLYERPGGPLMDGIIYTDRGSNGKDWTSDGLEMAQELKRLGGWVFPGDSPLPRDAVEVGFSTATRSLNRSSPSQDSNSREDWHTVPTSGQSLGGPNSLEEYSP